MVLSFSVFLSNTLLLEQEPAIFPGQKLGYVQAPHMCAPQQRLCLHHSDVFVLCFSVASRSSFDNVEAKWVPELRLHCPNSPILLVGTKSDLRDPAPGSKDAEWMKKRNIVCIKQTDALALAQRIGED